MLRIDAHQHYWQPSRFPYPWMPPPPSVLCQEYGPPDLQPILERNRFDGSIAVQAATHPGEADWLLELAGQHPHILGVVGWVDLTRPQLGHELDRLQRHPKFKGVRHPVHDEADDQWLLQPAVISGLHTLAERSLPYDLLLRPHHLPLIPRLADAVPDLQLVLDHIAKPPIAAGSLDGWAEDMARVSQLPQLSVKLSGMITEADWQHWTAEDLRPYVQHVLALFGPERLLFGSDWPVCLLAGTWKQVLAAFTQAVGPMPQAQREQMLGGAAQRVYRIAL